MSIENTSLLLNGKKLSFSSLKAEKTADYLPQERSVISFCQQWLEGRNEFKAQTSGSTGEPKTITLHRAAMEASAMLTQQALGLKPGITALLCLDPELIAGKMMMVRCMVSHMHLVVTTPVANPLDHLPTDVVIDFAAMVPLQVLTILESGRHPDFGAINTVIIGGGTTSEVLRASIQSLSTRFLATFGMTETLSHVALQQLNGENQSDSFTALPGIVFSSDSRGCLLIHAPYLGKDPIVSNDVVDLLTPTTFRWLGRWDNMINTGGIKVQPEEVERFVSQLFSKHGLSNKFFIAGTDHPSLGQEVVLVVEGAVDASMEESILRDLKASLDKYKAPRMVLYSKKFAITSLGKVRRKESLASASPRPRQ